jgi:hypothetical protein
MTSSIFDRRVYKPLTQSYSSSEVNPFLFPSTTILSNPPQTILFTMLAFSIALLLSSAFTGIITPANALTLKARDVADTDATPDNTVKIVSSTNFWYAHVRRRRCHLLN